MLAMQKSLPSQAVRMGVPALSCRPRSARMVVRSQMDTDKAVQVRRQAIQRVDRVVGRR